MAGNAPPSFSTKGFKRAAKYLLEAHSTIYLRPISILPDLLVNLPFLHRNFHGRLCGCPPQLSVLQRHQVLKHRSLLRLR